MKGSSSNGSKPYVHKALCLIVLTHLIMTPPVFGLQMQKYILSFVVKMLTHYHCFEMLHS